jgi:hypothetical protein
MAPTVNARSCPVGDGRRVPATGVRAEDGDQDGQSAAPTSCCTVLSAALACALRALGSELSDMVKMATQAKA